MTYAQFIEAFIDDMQAQGKLTKADFNDFTARFEDKRRMQQEAVNTVRKMLGEL